MWMNFEINLKIPKIWETFDLALTKIGGKRIQELLKFGEN